MSKITPKRKNNATLYARWKKWKGKVWDCLHDKVVAICSWSQVWHLHVYEGIYSIYIRSKSRVRGNGAKGGLHLAVRSLMEGASIGIGVSFFDSAIRSLAVGKRDILKDCRHGKTWKYFGFVFVQLIGQENGNHKTRQRQDQDNHKARHHKWKTNTRGTLPRVWHVSYLLQPKMCHPLRKKGISELFLSVVCSFFLYRLRWQVRHDKKAGQRQDKTCPSK